MPNRKVTKEWVDRVLDDASYLQKEAEALSYVIDEVPHQASPPEGYSIAQLLMLINHAQEHYYKTVINDAISSKRPISLNNYNDFKNTFTPPDEESVNIQKILNMLGNNRASLVNKLKKISLFDWQKRIYKNDKEVLLIEFVEEMNHNDHVHLKKITNLVQAYHQEKTNRREIKQRNARQNRESEKEG